MQPKLIRLPPLLLDGLKNEALAKGISVNAVIIAALWDFIERKIKAEVTK